MNQFVWHPTQFSRCPSLVVCVVFVVWEPLSNLLMPTGALNDVSAASLAQGSALPPVLDVVPESRSLSVWHTVFAIIYIRVGSVLHEVPPFK